MTEPPRPPGDGNYGTPPDPTSPPPPPPPPPGEYTAPPQYGYQQPAAGAPGPGMPPPGYASSDDKTWALVAHFGGAAGMLVSGGWLGWLAPLIAMLVKGQQSPQVRAHAVAALNFQLTWSIISVVGYILGICGSLIIIGAVFFIVPFIAVVVSLIFGILAGVKANEGQFYKYPMSVNIVK